MNLTGRDLLELTEVIFYDKIISQYLRSPILMCNSKSMFEKTIYLVHAKKFNRKETVPRTDYQIMADRKHDI